MAALTGEDRMDKYQQYDYDWLQCMKRIGRKELVFFEEDNVGYTERLIKLNCKRQILVWVYNTLRQNKEIVPVENLELDVKRQMWGFINELCTGKEVGKEVRIEMSKAFYTIEYFLKEKT